MLTDETQSDAVHVSVYANFGRYLPTKKWRFPEIGVPKNQPFTDRFSIINHPFGHLGDHQFMETPKWHVLFNCYPGVRSMLPHGRWHCLGLL